MGKIIKFLIVIFVIFILILVGGFYYIKSDLNTKPPLAEETLITFPPGTTQNNCINILNENGMLKPGWLYKFVTKIYSFTDKKYIIAGNYIFHPGITNKEIIATIFSGKSQYIIRITYPEGITLAKFAEITEQKLKIPADTFLTYVNSPVVLLKWNIKAKTAEGYLMPSTYDFFYNANIEKLANKLFETQEKLWYSKFDVSAKRIGWTRHKVLTLASIIEAETPLVSERTRISGVYHNRLSKKMRLQADPTIQYIVGGKDRLSYSDLKRISPYNTYLYLGLPPGPINSPGESSIYAALNPEQNDYIYFVAFGDGTNRHQFSRTLNEHQAYSAKYRRNLKKN